MQAFDDHDDDDFDEVTEFAGSIFKLDGEVLREKIRGQFLRIDGLPVRYEGEFVVPRESCLTPPMVWWDRVVLVTDDGLQMIIKCGQVAIRSWEVFVHFTSDPVDD